MRILIYMAVCSCIVPSNAAMMTVHSIQCKSINRKFQSKERMLGHCCMQESSLKKTFFLIYSVEFPSSKSHIIIKYWLKIFYYNIESNRRMFVWAHRRIRSQRKCIYSFIWINCDNNCKMRNKQELFRFINYSK